MPSRNDALPGDPPADVAVSAPAPVGELWRSRAGRALNALDQPRAVFLFLVPVFLQWIVPLVRSRFWLDETVTWWAGNQGLRELLRRCTIWPGSILYSSFILLLRSLGAHREWMLRLPSLLCAALAAALLFDLARRWFSQRVAIAAVVFFCTNPWVGFAAADARPYGMGLLAVVTATWLMLRWLDTQRLAVACAWGAAAAFVLHFQMLFATVLVFHACFLTGCFVTGALPRSRRVLRQLAAAAGVLAALALPLLPQYRYAFADRAVHTFPNPRTLSDLLVQFLPTLPMVAAAFIAALLPRWQPARRAAIPARSAALAVLWAAVPMSVLFAAAKLTGADLFVSRYVLPYVPGIALCFGIVLEFLSPRVRTGMMLLVFVTPVAVNCARGDFPSHTARGDWAAAIERVDQENRKAAPAPAMMRSPFPESDYLDWSAEKMDDSAIFAPLSFYPSGAEWHPLPARFTSGAARAIDNLMSARPATGHALFFVESGAHDPDTDAYLAYFRSKGNLRQIGGFEGVQVFRLQW